VPEQGLLEIRSRLDEEEGRRLSAFASLSKDALRRRPEQLIAQGHRQQYSLDADRVLHSLAYTRYIDKTQVFSLVENEHISHRVLHVQLVSKIGRTIGRMLGLNEDLIEAIALAHDIGHPPFGHDGEVFLGKKCREHGLGPFLHNVQSVHFLERVERRGQGLNLSLQVLDGVLCHDGEVHIDKLAPQRGKTFAGLDQELAAKQQAPGLSLVPMTLEGCVVRMADTVAYIGRDLEDAILLGLIARSDIPAEVVSILGDTNGKIVYRLVADLVTASAGRDYVCFSPAIAQGLGRLKQFNLERIYQHPLIKTEHHKIEAVFASLFDRFLADLTEKRRESPIFSEFLNMMDPSYRQDLPAAALVRDFLAAMTDDYLLRCYQKLTWPRRLPGRLGS